MRFMGIIKLDRLFSLIVLIVCCVAFFYSITGYLSQTSVDSSQLISEDLISLEHSQIAAQRHQLDSRLTKIAQDQAFSDEPTTVSVPTDEATNESAMQGFKIVGEGLRVPKGKDKHFLFIKTHKCGTSTLVNMLYLFGIRRRLNFVTQPWSRSLDIEKTLLPPRPGGHYNFQIAHAKFKPDLQHELLPKFRTFYTTIIRSPIKRFNSAFTYFNADKNHNRGDDGQILSFDDTINKWFGMNETVLEPTNTSCYIGYVVNGLSKDLGFEKYIERDGTLQEKIDDFIADLAQEFDFVLLTDYFDESLVLLKEQMGWEFQDIFFMKRYYTVDRSRKDSKLSQKTVELILKYNIVDVQLYNFFHQMYKMKVRAFGEELLKQKTAEFRRLRLEFENRCFNKPEAEDDEQTIRFIMNKAWTLTEFGEQEKSCTLLHMRDIFLDYMISELQVKEDFNSPNAAEMMKKWAGRHQPMSEDEKDLVMSIQEAYDDHGVHPVYMNI